MALNEIVLDALKQHIQDVIDLSDLLEMTDTAALRQAGMRKLQGRLEQKREEVERCQTLLRSLYESLTDGIIDREEYLDLKRSYTRRRDEAERQAEALREDISRELEDVTQERGWMGQFRRHQNITQLERSIVVSLIERILIYRGRRVEIVYRWQDEFARQMELLLQARQLEKAVG